MKLHELNHKVKGHKRHFITGRGQGSGAGKSAGRGTRGARAKSGWKNKLFREGGQMPIARRMPKRGFNNFNFAKTWAFVNLRDLNAFEEGAVVTLEACVQKGLVPRVLDGLKVLGHGTLEKKVSVKAQRISATARKAIEEKGGTVELLAAAGDNARALWKEKRFKGKSTERRNAAKAKAAAKKAQAKK
jgi:large subunit ribosomal protein L15